MTLETYNAPSQPRTGRFAPFSNCPVQVAGNQAMPDSVASMEIPVPRKQLFGGYGKQILLGHRTWRRNIGGDSATTTVNWELTLVRAHHR